MTMAERKTQIEQQFNAVMAEIRQHEARMNDLKTEAVRLQGAYGELERLESEQKGDGKDA